MEKTKINITDEVAIHISDMNKWFGNFHVLRDINLEVRRGCLLYTSPSPRDVEEYRMPSSD